MATRQVVIDVPEKVLLAEKTDKPGRLSSGRAAELAGMYRVEFLLALGRYRAFPFEAELRDPESGHAR